MKNVLLAFGALLADDGQEQRQHQALRRPGHPHGLPPRRRCSLRGMAANRCSDRWLFVCHGECPKNRLLTDCYGQPGLNWLCAGYRQFFAYVAADMDLMKDELEVGRSPADAIMCEKGVQAPKS